MSLTITVNDLEIISWEVNAEQRNVTAKFNLVKDNGLPYTQNNYAIFWETIPTLEDPQGNPISPPENWYQLPAQYSQILTDLTIDLRNGLLHLINE